MSENVGDLVQCLVENVVDDPDSVSIEEQSRRDGTQYLVKVAQSDVGRLIGKGGNVINAIRQIVDAKSERGARAQVKIVTED